MLFNKKFLPIGSVVGLKNDSRRLLTIGRQVYSSTNHIIRDYVAIEYPNGFKGADEMFVLFDFNDVETLYHYGYVDEFELKLDQMLNKKNIEKDDKNE